MDLTPIIQAVITVIALLITGFVIPWLKQHIDIKTQEKIGKIIDVAVKAAEQVYCNGKGTGTDKLTYVKDYLTKKGYKVDTAAIEAAVYKNFNTVYEAAVKRPEYEVPAIDVEHGEG